MQVVCLLPGLNYLCVTIAKVDNNRTNMNNILVPYDFDPQTDQAFDQAIHLAKHIGCGITLLYVHEQQGFLASLFSQEQKEEILERISDQMDAVAANMTIKSGVDIGVRIEMGRVYSVIADVANETDAAFIVMATRSHESSVNKSLLVGANTSRIIRSARCPVITIGGKNHYDGCRKIMLPVDHYSDVEQKVQWAVKLAGIYGAQVNVAAALCRDYKERVREKIRAKADAVHKMISKAGIGCSLDIFETEAVEKEAARSLLDYAKKTGDIDLIIIMTQRGPSIIEFFVDPQAQDIIRRSEIPVMSIVPHEASGKGKK